MKHIDIINKEYEREELKRYRVVHALDHRDSSLINLDKPPEYKAYCGAKLLKTDPEVRWVHGDFFHYIYDLCPEHRFKFCPHCYQHPDYVLHLLERV